MSRETGSTPAPPDDDFLARLRRTADDAVPPSTLDLDVVLRSSRRGAQRRRSLAGVAGVVALWWTSPVVEVADGELRAGRAHVPASLLGQVTTLDADAMRVQLGPRLDARAYVCLRAWARTGVHVVLEDPQDPTPYWLVSTRHPQRLADAVRAAHAA